MASGLPLFAGKIQRGKRLKNAKGSAVTSRHEYQSYSRLHKRAHAQGFYRVSVRPGQAQTGKDLFNQGGGAVAKPTIILVYCVLHLTQSWKTRLLTEGNACK